MTSLLLLLNWLALAPAATPPPPGPAVPPAELQVPDPGHMTKPYWGPDMTLVVHGRADPPPVAPKGAPA